jgi:hypothetical protein
MNFYICIIIILVISTRLLNAQCGCPGNNTEIGLTSFEEMTKQNNLYSNNFFSNIFYKFSFADNYIRNDTRVSQGPIEQLQSHFSNVKLIYKPINKLSIETDLGYLIMKRQVNRSPKDIIISSGLSDLAIALKYAIYKIPEENFEISIGTGYKIPVLELNEWIPQNIQPSTGAQALIFYGQARKYFPELKSGFLLSHRADINFSDKWNYRYGSSFISSLVWLYTATDVIHYGAELRNDIRLKDHNKNEILDESGMLYFSIAPLMRFTYQDLSITSFFEYPFYQYYNGFQIANKFSFTLNLSYGIRI